MKGWKFIKPFKLEEHDVSEQSDLLNASKIKMTKSLLTLSDVLRYSGEISASNVVLGSYGIGVISETDANLFGIEKGKRVYIEPSKACKECYNCKNGNEEKCSNLLTAGEDYNGFLSDFVSVDSGKLFVLPDSVSDLDALYIGHISLAISVVDKLGVQKGDYVAVIGANNFGVILAQLLIYYQAVPIVMTMDEEDYNIAKESGIYYVLGAEDNWQKEVIAITGGRLAKSAIFISDCNIPAGKAFAAAAYNAGIAYTGVPYKNVSVAFAQAVKKQLDIHCINGDAGNTSASINLIANKVLNLSRLKINTVKYNNIPKVLAEMTANLEKTGKIHETIVEMV